MMAEQIVPATPAARSPGGACARRLSRRKLPRLLQLPVAAPKRVLSGGRTPECLQRILRRPASLPRQLASLCGWVEKPGAPPPLMEGPLLGSCLEEAVRFEGTEHREQASGSASTAGSPSLSESLRPGKSGLSQASAPPSAIVRPLPGSGVRQGRLSAAADRSRLPLGNPARAPFELLARRAGGSQALSSLAPAPRDIHSRKPFSQIPAPPVARPANLPPVPPEWVALLNHRLTDHLNLHAPSMTPGMLFDREALGQEREGLAQPAWVLPLPSATAPLDLLLRLAGVLPAFASRRALRNVSEGQPSELLRAPAERSSSSGLTWSEPFSSAPRQAAPAPESLVPTGAQQGFYPQAGSLALPAAGQPNFRPTLAPPLAADTPPTLLSPQEVYDAPTPYAAASLRHEAGRDEFVLVQEDLDLLAAQIKRILDEEARRYGISV